jgi:hypothetical protein
MGLLHNQPQNKDGEYDFLVSEPKAEDERNYVENLWREFAPYADNSFKSDIVYNFHNRFWEMYLACTLLRNKLSLSRKSYSVGPDLLIDVGDNKNIWIEATVPGKGTGPDKIEVPEPKLGKPEVNRVPTEKIILRFRSAIFDKFQKFKKYRNEKIINENDIYIIAINGRRVPLSFLENEIPYIVQAVLPFGDETISFDVKTLDVIDHFYKYRPHIEKSTGASISTKIFLDNEHVGISAILYSNADLFNKPEEMGADFILVHNPYANNPIDIGWLPVGREYWVESNKLKIREA